MLHYVHRDQESQRGMQSQAQQAGFQAHALGYLLAKPTHSQLPIPLSPRLTSCGAFSRFFTLGTTSGTATCVMSTATWS